MPAQQHADHELTARGAGPRGQSPVHTRPVHSSPVLSGPVTISANDRWAGLSSPHSSLVHALWLGPLGDVLGKNSDRPCLN